MEGNSTMANDDLLNTLVPDECDESIVDVLGIESLDGIDKDVIKCLEVNGENSVLIDIENESIDMFDENGYAFVPTEDSININNSFDESTCDVKDVSIII